MQSQRNMGRVKLGELLVKAGVITDSQLKTALAEQKQWGGKLGDILVRMRYMSEDVFVRALSKQLGLPRADLSGNVPVAPEALSRVPGALAEEYEIVPCALLEEGKAIAIATSDPLNLTVLDALAAVARCRVVAYVAGPTAIRTAIARYYGEETPQPDPVHMHIVGNSEDVQQPGTGSSARPVSIPPPTAAPPLGVPATPAYAMPAPYPAAMPPVMAPVVPPVDTGTNPQLREALQNAQPYGYLFPPAAPAYAAPMPAPVPMPAFAPVPPPSPGPEEAQRREAAAIKALVELLVQKGVITLDEYLARLRR